MKSTETARHRSPYCMPKPSANCSVKWRYSFALRFTWLRLISCLSLQSLRLISRYVRRHCVQYSMRRISHSRGLHTSNATVIQEFSSCTAVVQTALWLHPLPSLPLLCLLYPVHAFLIHSLSPDPIKLSKGSMQVPSEVKKDPTPTNTLRSVL